MDFVISDTLNSNDITITHVDPVSDHDTLIIDIGKTQNFKLVKSSEIISYAYEDADKVNLRKAIFDLENDIRDLSVAKIEVPEIGGDPTLFLSLKI